MDIDSLIRDLETLAQVVDGDKLCIKTFMNEKRLFVDKTSYSQGIFRKISGSSREAAFEDIEKFLEKLIKSCDFLVRGAHQQESELMINAIPRAILGLEKLRETYTNDSNAVSQLSLVLYKLNNLVDQLKNIDNNCDY